MLECHCLQTLKNCLENYDTRKIANKHFHNFVFKISFHSYIEIVNRLHFDNSATGSDGGNIVVGHFDFTTFHCWCCDSISCFKLDFAFWSYLEHYLLYKTKYCHNCSKHRDINFNCHFNDDENLQLFVSLFDIYLYCLHFCLLDLITNYVYINMSF